MEWLYAVVSMVIGLGIGAVLGRAGSSAKQLSDELERTKAELTTYRGKVTQHFARTAELVEILASNSRDIYRHLATGSQELCDTDAIRLSDAVFKTLPEYTAADETASSKPEEAKISETAEVSAAAAQAEDAPTPAEGEAEKPVAARGNGGEAAETAETAASQGEAEEAAARQPDTPPSDVTTKPQGETKEADDSSSKSEWVELIPPMEEQKEKARLH